MKRLFFEINNRTFQYKVLEYTFKDDFYIFTDVIDGLPRRLHKSLYRGEEEVR